MRFFAQGQVIRTPYTLNEDGFVVVDGDMVLGTPEELFSTPDELASNKAAVFVRFPSATIFYAFDADLTADQQLATKRALNIVSSLAPVQFQRLPDGSTSFSGIRFKSGSASKSYCSSELGFQGVGKTTDVILNGCGLDNGGNFEPRKVWVIVHELGHSLGLVHEHQRTDTATYVDYDPSCVDTPFGISASSQFGAEGSPYGPYDLTSIMHYHSYTFAKDNLSDFSPDAATVGGATSGEIHLQIDSKFAVGTTSPLYQDAFDFDVAAYPTIFGFNAIYSGPIDGIITQLAIDGYEDPGSSYTLYPEPGNSEYTLKINKAWLEDRAVLSTTTDMTAASNWTIEARNSQARPACPVLLRAGTDFTDTDAIMAPNSFLHGAGDMSALWGLYGDLVDRSGSPTAGERFGTAIAFGDFDADGLVDFAVAEPTSSAVIVYRGIYLGALDTGELKYVPVEYFTPLSASALAAGDFNGDGYDDLAIGTAEIFEGGLTVVMGSDVGLEHGREPFELESELTDQWTGLAPDVPYMSGNPPSIWKLSTAQLLTLTQVRTPGVSINYADPDNTTTTGTGYVPTSGVDWIDDALPTFASAQCDKTGAIVDLFEPGAQIGYALHVADLDNDGRDDLLVGAPGAPSFLNASDPGSTGLGGAKVDLAGYADDTGVVLVFRGQPTTSEEEPPLRPIDLLTPYTATGPITNQPLYRGSHAAGRFGQAIATEDLDGDGCLDVIIGAPDDFARLGTTTPAETDGSHLGPGPWTNRPGRVFRFTNGLIDGVCLSTHPSANKYNSTTAACHPVFAATEAYEEPNAEVGAEFGYAVDAGLYGSSPRIFVGAPGTDYLDQPIQVDAGAGWVFQPNVASPVDRIDEDLGAYGAVRGYPPQRDDRFGSSLAYHSARGLLVGAPGDKSDRGAADWFEESGGLLIPTTAMAGKGVRATDLLADPTGARLGEVVQWVEWEGGTAVGPGMIVSAPGAIHALPSSDTGAVLGICGSGTSACSSPWSTTTGDVLTVTR